MKWKREQKILWAFVDDATIYKHSAVVAGKSRRGKFVHFNNFITK